MNPSYTPYRPKWHRPRMPIFWWLRQRSYAWFISRELTSLAVGYAAVFLLVYVWALSLGELTWLRLLSWLWQPPVLLFHCVVLLFLTYHTVTWLNLAPKAIVVRFAGRKVRERTIITAHYLAWLLVSAAVGWLVLRA